MSREPARSTGPGGEYRGRGGLGGVMTQRPCKWPIHAADGTKQLTWGRPENCLSLAVAGEAIPASVVSESVVSVAWSDPQDGLYHSCGALSIVRGVHT